jgi:RHS repeat-associated protein
MVTAGTSTYTFDAQGRRARKTVSGTTTYYFYASAQVISEKQGSQWTDYIFFGGERIAKQTGSTASTATYIHTDHLASTRVCTDSNGNSLGTCDYEPFGEVQPGTTCSVPTNYRFAGMEWESESSLYHTWFRQYDPSQGRWMSVDPLAGTTDNPQSQDRYVYVTNDPVNFIDPSGLNVCFVRERCVPGTVNGDASSCASVAVDVTCFGDDPGGGDGPGRGPEDETGGGGGNPPKEKAKKIVKFALSQEKLDDCIRQIFEGKATLARANRPLIVATHLSWLDSPRGPAVGAVVATQGRGKVGIDVREFYSPESSTKYLSAIYVHEVGNLFSLRIFGSGGARPAAPRVQSIFGGDEDTGANLENCVFGGRVLPNGDVIPTSR